MVTLRALALLAVLTVLVAMPASAAAALPPGFEEQQVVGGLTQPVNVAWAPDGRMFIAEKRGTLKVVPAGGGTAQIVDSFPEEVTTYEDRGFLGLAVDSSFAANGYLYLAYTAEAHPATPDAGPDPTVGLRPTYARVERVEVNAANQIVDRETILGTASPPSGACPADNSVDCIPSDSSSHSIGTVVSAPDGTLYVGAGDAAEYGQVDPKAFRTYDESSLAGKILHVDRDGNGLPGHAFCAGETNLDLNCTKIHAKGFRNPFRFTLRPDGALAVGDVGWSEWEELDLVIDPGTAWGWPCYEGTHHTTGYRDDAACDTEYAKEGTPAAHRAPIYQYPHNTNGSGAILAGPTYTGSSYPAEYSGSVFVADYTSGWIRRIEIAPNGQATPHLFTDSWQGLSLGEAPNGDLMYITAGDFGPGSGSIHRISFGPGGPRARATATPRFTAASSLTVNFNGGASTGAGPLTYHWDFGQGSPESGSNAAPSHMYTGVGTYFATLTVEDADGDMQAAEPIRIDVGNTPPTPTINGLAIFEAGKPVSLDGSATEEEGGAGGAVAPEKLTWNVVLVHNDHVHPQSALAGATASFVPTTDHDADSHYEVTLTAEDEKGLTQSVTKRLDAATAEIRLGSLPVGAPLSYAGRPLTAPTVFPSAIGFVTSVSAAPSFTRDGREYLFRGWSDGGARLHSLTVPAGGLTLVAAYDPATPDPPPPGPSVDAVPPSLRFDPASGFGKLRGILTGRVTDRSGVRSVDAALARRAGTRCRWWNPAADRPARRLSSCQQPRWMRARLTRLRVGGFRWRLALGAPPAPGTYVLRLRALDTVGNKATRAAGRRTAIPLRVRR